MDLQDSVPIEDANARTDANFADLNVRTDTVGVDFGDFELPVGGGGGVGVGVEAPMAQAVESVAVEPVAMTTGLSMLGNRAVYVNPNPEPPREERRGRPKRSASKSKVAVDEGGGGDEEFEEPRSVRYPKGGRKASLRATSRHRGDEDGDEDDGGGYKATGYFSATGGAASGRPKRAASQRVRDFSGGENQNVKRQLDALSWDMCEKILSAIEGERDVDAFLFPVDLSEYPEYLRLVETPMDLGTIRARVEAATAANANALAPAPEEPTPTPTAGGDAAAVAPLSYSVENFVRDMRLVWQNCMRFNRKGTRIYKVAQQLSARFEEMLEKALVGTAPGPSRSRTTRSGRQLSNVRSYAEDDFYGDFEDSDEKALLAERKREKKAMVHQDGGMKIDRILASRVRDPAKVAEDRAAREERKKRKLEKGASSVPKDKEEDGEQKERKADNDDNDDDYDDDDDDEDSVPLDDDGQPEREFLVKYEGLSYLHVKWVPRSEMVKHRQKLRRYENQLEERAKMGIEEPEEPFDPRYTEVQRVIDYVKDADGVEWYMCKWEELPYSESTWELPQDVNDDAKIQEFRRWSQVPAPPPPRPEGNSAVDHANMAIGLTFANDNELRSYQLEGLNWLIFNWYQRRGSILADEMGLGKTIQAVSFLQYLKEKEHMPGPFMVACNLSTLEHWYRELRTWTDLNTVVYYGTREDRAVIREHEFFFKNEKGHIIAPHLRKAQVILTTYDMICADDWEELRAIRWPVVVVDEAQRMKGHSSKFRENMIAMSCDHRVLLTGTPIQNNTTELWSLLNFVAPWDFPDMGNFQKLYGTLSTAEQVQSLNELLRPYLLRRLKEDVEKSIPPKEETIVEVELTVLQKQYYRAVLEQNRGFLNRGCSGNNVPHLLNVAIQLRKVCNHPFLLRGVEDKETASVLEADYFNAFINASGKMVLLNKLLPKLRADGHRVLIFSQMVKVLDLLETFLSHKGWKWERIDGSVRGNDRQQAIDRFCAPNSDIFVFLLCTRAGGVGINLTAADTVIIFDSDWNPQNDVQAQARCHRIGQTELVKVYRLITRNTYEREMFERSSKKLGLDQAVLHNMDLKEAETVLDAKDMEELLRFGAYDLFRDDDADNDRARQFVEADIEKILENQAVSVSYQRKKMTADGSSFSKATFQASAADRSLDMHAANFWDVVLGAERNAAYLLDLVQTGDLGSDADKKAEFFRDLEAACNNARKAWETGRAGELPADLHILAKVMQIVQQSSDFSAAQRELVTTWHRQVITPSRRGRDDADFAQRRSTSFASRSQNASDDKWTRYERSRVQKLLINYAAPRWHDIRVSADLPKRSLEDIKKWSVDFVWQCIHYSGDDETAKVFRQLLASMDAEAAKKDDVPEKSLDESVRDTAYINFIKGKVAGWARRVAETRKVHSYARPESGAPLVVPPFKKLLTRWWGPEADKQLMLAVAEHGMESDAVARIVKDPKYMFHLHPRPGEDEAAAEEDDEDAAPVPTKAGSRSRSSVGSTGGGGSSSSSKRRRGGGGDEKKLRGQLTVAVVLDGEKYECQNLIEEKEFPKDGFLWELYNPPTALLQKRLPFIMKGIDSYGREDEIRAEKLRKKREARASRQGRSQTSTEWTLRELKDFRVALMRYGPDRWDRIIAAARLNKTARRVDAYYKQLDAQCQEAVGTSKDKPASPFGDVVEAEGYRSDDDDGRNTSAVLNPFAPVPVKKIPKELLQLQEGAAALKKAKLGDEDDDDDDDDDDDHEEPDVDEDDNDDEENEEAASAPVGNAPPVTSEFAKRFVRRMRLFNDVRKKVLPHRRLAHRLACATEVDMPEFWETGMHDYYLLVHVARYGLGEREWTQLIESSDCPYLPTAASDAPSARKWLLGAVDKETSLVARLEYLRALVLSPQAVAGMTGRVGFQTYQARPKTKKDSWLPLKSFPLEDELPIPGSETVKAEGGNNNNNNEGNDDDE